VPAPQPGRLPGRSSPLARRAKGESPTEIAKALGVSRASVYRHLANASGLNSAERSPPRRSPRPLA